METLGAVASCVALVEVSLRTVDLLRSIPEIQEDFADLRKQIARIDGMIKDALKITGLFPHDQLFPNQFGPFGIVQVAEQLREIKDELETIATSCSRKPEDKTSGAKKRKWITHKAKIQRLYEKARDAKFDLQGAIQVQQYCMTTLCSSREDRLLCEILNRVQSLQQPSLTQPPNTNGIEELPEAESTKPDPLDKSDGTQISTIGPNTREGLVLHQRQRTMASSSNASHRYIQFQGRGWTDLCTDMPMTASGCMKGCFCRCHFNHKRYKTSSRPGNLLGSWLIRSASFREQCSDSQCQRHVEFYMKLEYRLPNWLLARSASFKASFSTLTGVSCALRPIRILGHDDEAWSLVQSPVEKFQQALKDGTTYYPNDTYQDGEGLIEMAIYFNAFDVLELLLKEWKNVLPKQGLPRRVAYNANIKRGANVGFTDREVNLLHQAALWDEDDSEWATTKVHMAASQGYGMEEALRDEGWAINELDQEGCAPLHIAVRQDHIDVTRQLIEADADINVRDWEGRTPLMSAACFGSVRCMKVFLKTKGLGLKSANGGTALHFAVIGGHADAVDTLVVAGASAAARNTWGYTPMHHLADVHGSEHAVAEILEKLLDAEGVDLEAENNYGQTPATFALFKNNPWALRCLVDAGASLHSINSTSENILHVAARRSGIEVFRYLTTLELSHIDTELRDCQNDTPWDVFLLCNHTPTSFVDDQPNADPEEQQAFIELCQGIRVRNLDYNIQALENCWPRWK